MTYSPPPIGLFVGLATVDLSFVVDAMPGPNTKVPVSGQQITAGGPVTNAAATFAFLGGSSTLVTAVGLHPLGEIIRQDMATFPVAIHDVAAERQEAPPVSSIFVVQATGERTVVSPRANAFSSVAGNLKSSWFDGVSVLLVDGHYMAICVAAARLARRRGIPVVLDSGSWKQGMDELLQHVDVAICSDDFHPPGCATEEAVLSDLAARGIKKGAVTRGRNSILYCDHGKDGEIAVPPIQAVDTLGAGDIFHGAFCYAACRPESRFCESLSFAARVATFSCRYRGTRLWMRNFAASQ